MANAQNPNAKQFKTQVRPWRFSPSWRWAMHNVQWTCFWGGELDQKICLFGAVGGVREREMRSKADPEAVLLNNLLSGLLILYLPLLSHLLLERLGVGGVESRCQEGVYGFWGLWPVVDPQVDWCGSGSLAWEVHLDCFSFCIPKYYFHWMANTIYCNRWLKSWGIGDVTISLGGSSGLLFLAISARNKTNQRQSYQAEG